MSAPDDVTAALMDSAYLAGVGAGWNAAQADDPNAALAALHASRAGYLKPITEKRHAAKTPSPPPKD